MKSQIANCKLQILFQAAPWLVIAAVIVVWLWPITLAGRMPIGGDVTSFFLPLMSYYRRALLDGRIPLWNELWGFGFPMLAESQAGVFYPPHLILFRLFETETAYSLNIVLHHLLAGWFAYLCGREFGLRRWGATLTGLVFAGNGFFIIHFPHQWSYTTGCWMPLAVALAWRAMGRAEGGGQRAESRNAECPMRNAESAGSARSRLRAALLLALVLAVQMLAGHFQLAFYTQIIVLLMGLSCTVQSAWSRLRAFRKTSRRKSPLAPIRNPQSTIGNSPTTHQSPLTMQASWGIRAALLWAAVPVVMAFTLAAVQILPTYELIKIALPDGRDFEYLSGFANTPFHLVSYLLPTLFHVNPLWRPVAWDPFHTSPEECFSYVGLLPLGLALAGSWRWRREPRVRLWVILIVVTLLLSLGPYVPGFKLLIHLPGFGGFRAASRWSLTTALFIALLAGRTLDGLHYVERLRWWLRGLVALIILVAAPCVGLALTWLGSSQTDSGAMKVAEMMSRAISPWPKELDRHQIIAQAQRPQTELRTLIALANLGYRVEHKAGEPPSFWSLAGALRQFTLVGERQRILLQELIPPVVMLAVLWICWMWLVRVRRTPRWLLLGLASLDLGAASWLRPTDFAPLGRLTEQSPVLTFLDQNAHGDRIVDSHQNLAMLAGAAPVQSYRTVDIPIWQNVLVPDKDTRGTMIPPGWKESVLTRCGVEWELVDRDPVVSPPRYHVDPPREGIELTDLVLGRILYGPGLLRSFPGFVPRFVIRQVADGPSRAWFAPADPDPVQFQELLRRAQNNPQRLSFPFGRFTLEPLSTRLQLIHCESDQREFEVEAVGPGAVVVSELTYPGWKAELRTPGGELKNAVQLSQTGCQVVPIPREGKYQLVLSFRSHSYEWGCMISAGAMSLWLLAMLATLRAQRRRRRE
ncbi:MAG: hypothetical protein HY000_10530 [Planctomycetes bacterium]|nr:hypothetical protein [Planctomycetota bacterium]